MNKKNSEDRTNTEDERERNNHINTRFKCHNHANNVKK